MAYSIKDEPHEVDADISRYQWPNPGEGNCQVDFATLKANTGQLSIIRAGSIEEPTGNTYADFRLIENFTGADAFFEFIIFYWYARLKQIHDAIAQARAFASFTANLRHNALMVDVEEPGPADKLKELCFTLRDITKARIGIYTSVYKWGQITGDKSWASEFDLWVAHWGTDTPSIPEPWKSKGIKPVIHQFEVSKEGQSKYGVCSKGLDLNYVSLAYLQELRDAATPPNPPEIEPVWYKTVANVNIRNSPVVNPYLSPRGSKLYTSYPGQEFIIDEIDGDWAQGRVYIHKDYIVKL